MVGWHHRLDGHGFEQALGVDDGQRGLVFCNPWDHKESDTTERLTHREVTGAVPSDSEVWNLYFIVYINIILLGLP